MRFPAKAVVGLPTVIGAVGAVCQYGAIPFLTTFAVAEWHLRAGQAAALLAVGRVLSILAKVLSGASSDRRGPIASARTTGSGGRRHRNRLGHCCPPGGRPTPAPPCSPGR